MPEKPPPPAPETDPAVGSEAVAGDDKSLLTPRFALVMVASLAYFTGLGALLPTVPRYIEDELGGGGIEVGIGVGAFAVSAALLRPWVGRIGDTKGRRVLAVFGCVVVAVSVLGYEVASSLPLLVVSRLLTGVGEAAVFVGFATAAQDLAPDHRRGEAASYFSVALYGGLAVGPPLGEALVDQGFAVLWAVVAGLTALAALLSTGLPRGHTVAVAPRRSFLQPDGVWPGVILLLGLIPFVAFSSFIPLYADEVGLDDVGPVFVLYAGLVLVIRIFGARIPDRMGWRQGSTLALCSVAAGILLVAAWGEAGSIWVAAVLLGLGMSLLYPALFTAVMANAPADERTHAVGTFSVFFDLAQGFGATIVGAVVSITASERGGFAAAGALALTGLLAQRILGTRIAGAAGAAAGGGAAVPALPPDATA